MVLHITEKQEFLLAKQMFFLRGKDDGKEVTTTVTSSKNLANSPAFLQRNSSGNADTVADALALVYPTKSNGAMVVFIGKGVPSELLPY